MAGEAGRTCMTEYLDNPDATATTLVDGWLHTGDTACADEESNLYFVDRAKDVIKRAGENVACSEVERVMDEHPDVVESAVVGVSDDVRDQALGAYVVPTPGARLVEGDITGYVSGRLARFKVPDRIVFIDALPRTAVGKIQKHLLVQRGPAAAQPATTR